MPKLTEEIESPNPKEEKEKLPHREPRKRPEKEKTNTRRDQTILKLNFEENMESASLKDPYGHNGNSSSEDWKEYYDKWNRPPKEITKNEGNRNRLMGSTTETNPRQNENQRGRGVKTLIKVYIGQPTFFGIYDEDL